MSSNANSSSQNGTELRRILLTGGAGYIGSHVALELLKAGYLPVIIDNGHNSKAEACVRNIVDIAKNEENVESLFPPNTDLVELHTIDLLDTKALEALFARYDKKGGILGVIHLAAWKAVGESGEKPLEYYQNNVTATLNLLQAMRSHNVRNFVYSSSATVYGEPDKTPIPESAPFRSESAYARTKVFCEQILMDLAKGKIGEDPQGRPNNLLPLLSAIAIGRIKGLKVFGNDFPTPDGTCLRDYMHVCDLAAGHVKAMDAILKGDIYSECKAGKYRAFNLGSGKAFSVLQMIDAMRKATGFDFQYEMVGRRAGDVPDLTADPTLAHKELGWKTTKDLETMCRDLWKWQSTHPQGFA